MVWVVVHRDSSSDTQILVNYYDHTLSHLKTLQVSQTGVDLEFADVTGDLGLNNILVLNESNRGFYSQVVKINRLMSDTSSDEINVTTGTTPTLSATTASQFAIDNDLQGRTAFRFINFTTVDLDVVITNGFNDVFVTDSIGEKETGKINTFGIAPTFTETNSRKFYIKERTYL